MKTKLLSSVAGIATILAVSLAALPAAHAQLLPPAASLVGPGASAGPRELRADQVVAPAPAASPEDDTNCAPNPGAPFDGLHEYTCAYQAFRALHIDLADPARLQQFEHDWAPKNFLDAKELKTQEGTFRLIRAMRDSLRNRVFPDHNLFDYVHTPEEHTTTNKTIVNPKLQGGIGAMVKLNNDWQIREQVVKSLPNPDGPMSFEQFKAFQEKLNASMVIGPGHELMVDSPVRDSPAYGLLKDNDLITAIDGQSLDGKTLSQATGMLRGDAGTPVTITVKRVKANGATVTFNLTLVRAAFDEHAVIVHDINGIRHIIVTDFSNSHLLDDFHDALVGAKGMKGIDVDVRGNPGGRLAFVTAMLEMMVSRGEILKQQYRVEGTSKLMQEELLLNPDYLIITSRQVGGDPDNAQLHAAARQDYTADYGKAVDENGDNYVETHPLKTVIDESMPVTVDINGESYSASEIFAGALQATHRATIVGEPSPGKGVIMSMVPLPDAGDLSVTSGRYFPGGIDTENVGIIPDVEVTPAHDFGKTDNVRDAASSVIEKAHDAGAARKIEEQQRVKINIDNFNKMLDDRDHADQGPDEDSGN